MPRGRTCERSSQPADRIMAAGRLCNFRPLASSSARRNVKSKAEGSVRWTRSSSWPARMGPSPCLDVGSPPDSSSGEFGDRCREIAVRLDYPVDPLPRYAQENRDLRDTNQVVAHGKSIPIY
jgi:hypothetical protein